MVISVDFDWNAAGRKYIENMPERLRESLIKGIREAMFLAEAESKKGFGRQSAGQPPNDPPGPLIARTGHLRRSVDSGIDESTLTGYIGTDVKYGRVHELGGKHTPARPFLLPAIMDNLDEIQDIMQDNIARNL